LITNSPEVAAIVCVPEPASTKPARLNVCVFVELFVSTVAPVKAIELPDSVNAPAVLLKMIATFVPEAPVKLLLLVVSLLTPAKTSVSPPPLGGVLPVQLPLLLLQLFVVAPVPPPAHVKVVCATASPGRDAAPRIRAVRSSPVTRSRMRGRTHASIALRSAAEELWSALSMRHAEPDDVANKIGEALRIRTVLRFHKGDEKPGKRKFLLR
jgi:hypothetical protein